MKNITLKTFLLMIVIFTAAACGVSPTETTVVEEPVVEPAQPVEEASSAETMAGEMMEDEAMSDEAMADDKMDDEAMSDEAMADEAMADDKMDDEAMSDEAMADDKTDDEAMSDEAMADEMMDDEAMTELPAWFKVPLTDVNSGESFTIADLQGKVVVVETMAVWCPNCTRQQGHVKAMQEIIGQRDDLVNLALNVDPNESADFLLAHAQKNGFTWRYAVAPAEVAREIGQLYGAQFLNPPATPMFIIDRQGEVHPLPFGHKDSTELAEAVSPFLDAG